MHSCPNMIMENYKTCPRCGQEKIPFKLGVCIFGRQMDSIQYVKDSQEFAANHDSFLGIRNKPLISWFEPVNWECNDVYLSVKSLHFSHTVS